MKRLISAGVCKGILSPGAPIAKRNGENGIYINRLKEQKGLCYFDSTPAWHPFPFEKAHHNELYLRTDTTVGFNQATSWLANLLNLKYAPYARFFLDNKFIIRSAILSSGSTYIRFVPFECDYIGDIDKQAVVESVFDCQEDSAQTMLSKICEFYGEIA